MALFTLGKLDNDFRINVRTEVEAANWRLMERYTHCTVRIVDVGDEGRDPEWVTIDLQVKDLASSAECIDWYSQELNRRGVVLLHALPQVPQ
jgi:hypothetical protein